MYYISAKSVLALLPANSSEVRSFVSKVIADDSMNLDECLKEVEKLEVLAAELRRMVAPVAHTHESTEGC